MYKSILYLHYFVVTLFLFIYVIKTILLLSNKTELLSGFTRKTKVFEMIVSVLFLISGIYLATQLPFGGKFDYLFWIKLVMVFASIPVAIIGFRKNNKILAALSLLLITGSYGIAEVYSKRKGVPKGAPSVSAHTMDGKTLYQNNCSLCHGSDGKLGMSGATDLTASALDKAAMIDVILNGKGAMPPVRVNEEQARAIAEFADTELKRGGTP